ncbi:MAG: glycosyltransferase family 4 protein [Dissulfurimicrobium sp.]|uniref:glycosyltransferase family 4 protein n=1 Tax=Dissulfurimicrobium sp. TaxID=2022436 RepID=UPI0040495E01
MNTALFSIPISFFTTYLLIKWMLRSGVARLAIDAPNERSLHKTPVPRTGGIGIIAGVVAGWAILGEGLMFYVLILSVLLAAVSFLDDIKDLHAGYRLPIHLMLAGIFAVLVYWPHISFYAVFLVTLSIAWMTNLFNFMDGSDGLAGGMAVLGFGFYGLSSFMAGDMRFFLINLTISASSFAFLLYNFYPARIFMGDAGSTFLGFLSGAMGFIGWQKGLWSLWAPMLIFSPFIVDATLTLIKRMIKGENIWQAHREHYYQRLIQMGYGHKKTAVAGYFFMIFFGILGCFLPKGAAKWIIILFAFFIYVIFILVIDICWKRHITKKYQSILRPPFNEIPFKTS